MILLNEESLLENAFIEKFLKFDSSISKQTYIAEMKGFVKNVILFFFKLLKAIL